MIEENKKTQLDDLITQIKEESNKRYEESKNINAINIKNLVIDFGETLAVDNANITIKKGELVTLLGPSGCGKTTTLNAIAGLITPTSGQIFFSGIDVTKKTPQDRKIGLVFQNYALYPHLNVFENIAFPLTNDKKWKIRQIEKSIWNKHKSTSLLLEANGASLEEIKTFDKFLYNFFDVYKQIELTIGNLKSDIYKELNELNAQLNLIPIHKQAEIKKESQKALEQIIKFKNDKKELKQVYKEDKNNLVLKIQELKQEFKEFNSIYKNKIKEIKNKYKEEKKSLLSSIKEEKEKIKKSNEIIELNKNKKSLQELKKYTKNQYYNYQKELTSKYSLNESKLSETQKEQYKNYLENAISWKEAINREVLKVAEKVEITKNLTKKPTKLSGGQQQRVAIARGIVREPEILLMDEPLSNLDAKLRVQTRQWIKKIQSEIGITTIFVTHDQEEAMSISDKIVCMSTGKVQQVGTPMELYNKPINEFVAKFLGIPEMAIFTADIDQYGKISISNNEIANFENINNNKIRVGIRAEHLEETSTGKFSGYIQTLEYLGKDIFAKLKVENIGLINIFLKNKLQYEINEEIRFNIPENKIHLFDVDTKERIN